VELHDAAAVGLDDLAALDQQVDVPEHLAQREVGLRDRDVAPDRLRDLVRGARRSEISPPILRARRSCISKRSSITAAWSPNSSPWPGRTRSIGISRVRRSESMYISSARGRPSPGSPERPPSGREISGFDEMCLIRWSPPAGRRSPGRRRSCPTASARAGGRPAACARRTQLAAVAELRVTGALPPQPRNARDIAAAR
jgi:hypothetical protein